MRKLLTAIAFTMLACVANLKAQSPCFVDSGRDCWWHYSECDILLCYQNGGTCSVQIVPNGNIQRYPIPTTSGVGQEEVKVYSEESTTVCGQRRWCRCTIEEYPGGFSMTCLPNGQSEPYEVPNYEVDGSYCYPGGYGGGGY